MQAIKQLGTFIEQATSDSHSEPPFPIYEKILELIHSRVDMYLNKKQAQKCNQCNFETLVDQKQEEYLSYHCELSLFSQIATKEFLLKISGILMNKEMDPLVHEKVLKTVKVWDQIFRPYEDLLPMYFQFYAGLLRKQFPINHTYNSPYKPKDFNLNRKVEKKERVERQGGKIEKTEKPQLSMNEQEMFESIRMKIILTNEIIDNCNPAEGTKGNTLLIQMMEQIKNSEQTIRKTINQNLNEKIMELALALNDDIFITKRRYKDLQKNKKPQLFILTQLASDVQKQYKHKDETKKTENQKPSRVNQPKDIFDSFDQPTVSTINKSTVQKKNNEIDIMDINYEPKQQPNQNKQINKQLFDLMDISNPSPPVASQSHNIFDLLGQPQKQQKQQQMPVGITLQNSNIQPSGLLNRMNLNEGFESNNIGGMSIADPYNTQYDIKGYQHANLTDKLSHQLTNLKDLFQK